MEVTLLEFFKNGKSFKISEEFVSRFQLEEFSSLFSDTRLEHLFEKKDIGMYKTGAPEATKNWVGKTRSC